MDFFNNQEDNTKLNEALLDQIMEQQRRREEKHNIKKGYLLSRKVGPVSNPYEKDATQKESVLKSQNSNQPAQATNEPLYVVGGKKYSNKPKTLGISSQKIKRIIFSFLIGLVVIASIFVAVFLLNTHTLKFVCGNIEGIAIYDEDNEQIDDFTLRLYQSATFRIELKPNYSNSDVQVFYNNVELKKDSNGYYKLKYSGESDEIRIMGVMENQYTITLKPYNTLKFYTKDDNGAWAKDISNLELDGFLGDKLQFKIYDTVKQTYVLQPYACVYAGEQLLTATNDIYEIPYTKNLKVTAYNNSPFECFKMTAVFDQNNQNSITSYKITDLTETGMATKILSLPNIYNGLPVTYAFGLYDYFPTIEELIVNAGSISNYRMFERFNDLQRITIVENQDSTLYSENGILYNRVVTLAQTEGEEDTTTIQLIKCPSGYGKSLSEGERIVSVNPDVICSNAFSRLNYIKTVNIGSNVKTIEPLAFKGENLSENYTFNISAENTNYKVVNNIIYSIDESTIVSAQFATGEFHVENGKVIAPNAFSFSNITKLVFDGEATIQSQGIAMIDTLKEIVLPSNLTSLSTNILLGDFLLEVIDLTNIASVVEISELATLDWTTVQKIIVSDDLFESYTTTYADSNLLNLFIKVSDIQA